MRLNDKLISKHNNSQDTDWVRHLFYKLSELLQKLHYCTKSNKMYCDA